MRRYIDIVESSQREAVLLESRKPSDTLIENVMKRLQEVDAKLTRVAQRLREVDEKWWDKKTDEDDDDNDDDDDDSSDDSGGNFGGKQAKPFGKKDVDEDFKKIVPSKPASQSEYDEPAKSASPSKYDDDADFGGNRAKPFGKKKELDEITTPMTTDSPYSGPADVSEAPPAPASATPPTASTSIGSSSADDIVLPPIRP